MSQDIVRIATRKSKLALWQAEHVAARLHSAYPEIRTELVRMTTRGDKILDVPLAKVGGKGLFVKELEQGILGGTADIAVHSMKDVPAELPSGLHIAVVLQREDPRDAFVSNKFSCLDALPEGAVIGTSSLRRQAQLKDHFPSHLIRGLRGNVNTRLAKLDTGDFDAVILAVAGLKRLELADRIRQRLDPSVCLPAIGQGVIGIECRSDDPRINQLLQVLQDDQTRVRVAAERAMNKRLQGGCQVPIAGYAELVDERIHLRGLVGKPDGSVIIRGEVDGPASQAREMGIGLADDLLSRGADTILRELFE